jgi:hypothetical protein
MVSAPRQLLDLDAADRPEHAYPFANHFGADAVARNDGEMACQTAAPIIC